MKSGVQGDASVPEPRAAARLTRESYHRSATGAERDYFVYFPARYDSDPAVRWPLLVMLHGDGERGNAKEDLDYLLKNGPLYEAWIQKRDLPFIIAAPQLPLYGRDQSVSYLVSRTRAEIPQRLADAVPARPPEDPTPAPMLGAVADAELPHGPEGPPDGWSKLEADLLLLSGPPEARGARPLQAPLQRRSGHGPRRVGTCLCRSRSLRLAARLLHPLHGAVAGEPTRRW